MWQNYYCVTSVEEALELLAEHGPKARVVAGATDLILEMERGVRKGIETLIDITRVPCLDEIVMDEDELIHLGPMVTHNQCVASKLVVERL
ncbi:MAG: FAD binding domain-containing protein, partial [Anaerolineales bacterium]|nr:FAD binding domain-containing protein [Anaerolineales bacterium]